MKAKTKKFQGRRYELISLEALIEQEEAAGDHEMVNRDWESEVAEALDDEAWYKYNEVDANPWVEVAIMRTLHR
jgi:hypothetical protein